MLTSARQASLVEHALVSEGSTGGKVVLLQLQRAVQGSDHRQVLHSDNCALLLLLSSWLSWEQSCALQWTEANSYSVTYCPDVQAWALVLVCIQNRPDATVLHHWVCGPFLSHRVVACKHTLGSPAVSASVPSPVSVPFISLFYRFPLRQLKSDVQGTSTHQAPYKSSHCSLRTGSETYLG